MATDDDDADGDDDNDDDDDDDAMEYDLTGMALFGSEAKERGAGNGPPDVQKTRGRQWNADD